jgi:hypothetical protein
VHYRGAMSAMLEITVSSTTRWVDRRNDNETTSEDKNDDETTTKYNYYRVISTFSALQGSDVRYAGDHGVIHHKVGSQA